LSFHSDVKVVVAVPTNRYGGLDILFSSLKRQTYPSLLVMADELRAQRLHIYEEHGFIEKTVFVENEVQSGNKRALAQAYNNMADFAVDFEFDLMVSLQDYIWIPDNGVEMFVEDYLNYPDSLITGLVSLSEAPGEDEIEDECAYYSIFKTPLIDKPEGISWHDVRDTALYPGEPDIRACDAGHWEANWAAIPVSLLTKGIRWDLDYDRGIAYENVDFAKRCERDYGTSCVLDKRNHAYGVPHRKIWPKEEKELERYSNRWEHEKKWRQ